MRVDGGVVAFAFAAAAAAGLLFGAMPAWRGRSQNIHNVLKSSRGQTAGRSLRRTQSFLVISEVALSVMLLAGAGLLLGSFLRLRNVDPGFRPEGVLAASVSSAIPRGDLPRITRDRAEMLAHLRALPGVEAAGLARELPLEALQRRGLFRIENRQREAGSEAGWQIVSAGTLETLRIPILRGRGLTDADTSGAPSVAVVNDTMARRFWPGRDPIGERIWFESMEKEHWLTIVGVAARTSARTVSPSPRLRRPTSRTRRCSSRCT
jgi:putative ABC transport system permease protein